jgi:hypothetical protein
MEGGAATSSPPLSSDEQIKSLANLPRLFMAWFVGTESMPRNNKPCTNTEAVSDNVGLRVGTQVGPWLGTEVGMGDRKTLKQDLVVSGGGAHWLVAVPLTV